METIWNFEISLIIIIQTALTGLSGFFKAITFLGSEEFFILVMPALYWCVDTGAGLRIGMILLLSGHLNGISKVTFHSPRPFWFSPDVKALSTEMSFGMTSGHSMSTASIWGLAAYLYKKRWFTIGSAVVIFLVGFSRIALGMHFMSDVLAGWALGLVLLFIFIRLNKQITTWLLKKGLAVHIWIVVGTTLLILASGYLPYLIPGEVPIPAEWINNAILANPEAAPQPYDPSGIFTTAGVWLGMGIGAAWLRHKGGLTAPKSPRNQLLRYLIGLVGIAIFWYGLGAVFPRGEDLLPLLLRLIRYALVGLWIGVGAPMIYKKINL